MLCFASHSQPYETIRNLLLLAAWPALLCLISPVLRAQTLPVPRARIDSAFAAWSGDQTPGLVLGIVYRGQLIHRQAFGMADVAKRESLTPDHAFWVASVAKQFTGACVALLAESGKISLDDDVRKFLPRLPRTDDTVRIGHLLYHTSGLRDGFTLIGMSLKGEKHYTNANVLGYLARQNGVNFKPGERHEYNNGGYVLLAEIVARASGMPFAAFAEENIFRPLGMRHTKFCGSFAPDIPGLATGYGVRYRKGRAVFRPAHFRGNATGSSELVTTLEDLCAWDRNFYRNRLGRGGAAFSRLLTTAGQTNDGARLPYAFGLEVEPYRGVATVTHSGSDPGYKAEIVRFPELELTVIGLTNAANVYNLTARLLQIGEWL